MISVCLATNNLHKIEEIKALIGDKFNIMSLKEISCFEELPETGKTLEENSKQKARYVFEKYHVSCIADDSGLEVSFLNNKPGVDSAHYSGTRDADDNMDKVLNELGTTNQRDAVFKTVITYINAIGEELQFVGRVEGRILNHKKGGKGFGYDPIFMPNGYDLSFAEMDSAQKNAISHRAMALKKFVAYIV